MSILKRTQMYFPEDMLRELRGIAKREKSSISDIVRNAVREFLGKEKPKNWQDDPLWNMIGVGASKDGDLSVHHDKYLYGDTRKIS